MVSDEERDYMYLAYSADPRMRINVGIRRRLAPLMDNNRRRIELLNSLLFSFPGTPILYYGDEIGMGDNIYLGDRNGVRTPMQWSADRNAGFSRATPARLFSPVIMDPVYGYEAVNVEAQQGDPSSLLNWMRNMIALRKLFRVFGRGSIEFLHPANRKVLAYVRRYDGETVLCVANLSRFAQPVELDLSAFDRLRPVEMLGYVEFPSIDEAAVSADARALRVPLVRTAAAGRAARRPGRRGACSARRWRLGRPVRGQRAGPPRDAGPAALPAGAALVRRQGAHDSHRQRRRLGAVRRDTSRAAARRRRIRRRARKDTYFVPRGDDVRPGAPSCPPASVLCAGALAADGAGVLHDARPRRCGLRGLAHGD